jgi:hypothetical protein
VSAAVCLSAHVLAALETYVGAWRVADDLEEGRHRLAMTERHVPMFEAAERLAGKLAPSISGAAGITPAALEELLLQLMTSHRLTVPEIVRELESGRWQSFHWHGGPSVRVASAGRAR